MLPLACVLAALAAADPAPAPPQPLPTLDADFAARGVLAGEVELRRGPDLGTPAIAIAPAGTLVAVAQERAGRFVRVRLASGTSGFAPSEQVERGAAAEEAWASPSAVPPPRPVEDPRLAPDYGRRPHRHDGLLLRAEFAGGPLRTASGIPATTAVDGASIRGRSIVLALTAAAAVTDDALVGGQLWLVHAAGATNAGEWKPGYEPRNPAPLDESASFDLVGLAPVICWYSDPLNFHLAIAPGFALARVDTRNPLDWRLEPLRKDWSPRIGLGVRVTAGLELWATDDVGFGPAFSAVWGWNPEAAWSPLTWNTFAWSVGLSATWN